MDVSKLGAMAHAHAPGQGIERGAGPGAPDALAARRAGNRRRMLGAAAINAALIAAGVIGGVLMGSLALLADAGHVLSDLAAIGLAVLAGVLAARPGGPRRTFGYQRSEVIAALVNGVTLVAIAVLIVVAAVNRLGDPPEVKGAGVLIIGVVGWPETRQPPGCSPRVSGTTSTWRRSSGTRPRTRSARSG